VSLAKGVRLTELRQATELTAKVREHLEEEAGPEPAPSEPFRLLRKNWREAAIAVGVSVVLWALVIPGSKESERTVRVPVVIENLPVGYALENVDPAEVEATVSGLRRDLFFLDSLRMEAAIDSFLVQLGRRTFEVAPESVRHSGRVTVTAVEPRRVSVLVKRTAADEGKREKDATVQEKAQ
jgi:hypothetical protein